jgi:hypothetical protein
MCHQLASFGFARAERQIVNKKFNRVSADAHYLNQQPGNFSTGLGSRRWDEAEDGISTISFALSLFRCDARIPLPRAG